MRKQLRSAVVLSTVGVGGFLLGKLNERLERQHHTQKVFSLKNVPALPIFSTVFAATPAPIERNSIEFADSGSKIDRTSEVNLSSSSVLEKELFRVI